MPTSRATRATPARPEDEARPSRGLNWSACLGAFVVTLSLSITNVAIPDLRADFPDASTAALSWVLNAYAIVFGAVLVAAGRWGDERGLRTAFLAGLVTFTVGSLIVGEFIRT